MAVTAPLYNSEGTKISEIELPESLFAIEPHGYALQAYVRMYLANQRQGTVKTKQRGEVSGGGAKPWRQKGTGRARAGSNTSPVWVGGGRSFGPRPRDHRERLPRKVKSLAMRSVLSLRAGGGNVHVIEDVAIDPPKTRAFVQILKNIGFSEDASGRVLFLTEGKNLTLDKSVRNVPFVQHRRACLANPYEVLRCRQMLVTRTGLAKLVEVFGS